MKWLHARGGDIHAVRNDSDENTLMSLSVKSGNFECFKWLYEHGVNRENIGSLAAIKNNVEILRFLRDHGSNITTRNIVKDALCFNQDPKSLQYIHECGGDISYDDEIVQHVGC